MKKFLKVLKSFNPGDDPPNPHNFYIILISLLCGCGSSVLFVCGVCVVCVRVV